MYICYTDGIFKFEFWNLTNYCKFPQGNGVAFMVFNKHHRVYNQIIENVSFKSVANLVFTLIKGVGEEKLHCNG